MAGPNPQEPGRVEIAGGWLRRNLERLAERLPYWPDPDARCPAHGRRYCAGCHRNPSTCRDFDSPPCGYWQATGMHWDTCPNRVTTVTDPQEPAERMQLLDRKSYDEIALWLKRHHRFVAGGNLGDGSGEWIRIWHPEETLSARQGDWIVKIGTEFEVVRDV